MKHSVRRFLAVVAATILVAACGQSESDTSDDRDRNVPISETMTDADFGVNGNGVAVNALWDDRETVIGQTRTVTLNDRTTVYSVVSVLDRAQELSESSDLTEVEFKVAKVNTTSGQPMFDKTYGLKTMKLTPTPTHFDQFIPTRNGYGIYVVANKEGATTGPTMRRYRLDTGQADTAFGTTGVISLPSLGVDNDPTTLRIVDVADEPDGRMVVLVASDNQNFLMRMNTKGVLDLNFGIGGVVAIPLEFGELRLETFRQVVLWSDNANQRVITLVGHIQKFSEGRLDGNYVMDLRLSNAGVIDTQHIDDLITQISMRAVPENSVIESAIVDFSGTTARQLNTFGYSDAGPSSLRVNVSFYYPDTGAASIALSDEQLSRGSVFPETDVFEDYSRAFSPDEKRVWSLSQFATEVGLYNIGVVHNRASNFSGLAIGRSQFDKFDLYDVLRVTDYASDAVLASKIVTGGDGTIRFTMTGLTSSWPDGVTLEEDDIGLAQATWGVGMTENGLPVSGFGGDKVWAKNPVTVDYLSSYMANSQGEDLKRSLTLIGENNTMYLIETPGDGYDVTIREVDVAKKTLGDAVKLTWNSWGMSGLPPNPDAMEIRDGYLYVAANFMPTEQMISWPWMSGVARYSLSDGAMDESFGVQGVMPINDAYSTPRNRTLILHDDGSFNVTVLYPEDNAYRVHAWKSPEVPPTLDEWYANPPGIGFNRSEFLFVSDIYSDDTLEGPVGYTIDTEGRMVLARVRRSRDLIEETMMSTMRIWRFLPNGQPDETFGTDGRVEADLAGWSKVAPDLGFNYPPQVAVTRQNKLLIGFFGRQATMNENGRWIGNRRVHVLARLMPDGTMDALKGPEPTPIPIAAFGPAGNGGSAIARETLSGVVSPPLPSPATEVMVPIVEKLDPAPVVLAAPAPAPGTAKPDAPAPESPSGVVSAAVQSSQLKIIAMTSAVDRSIGVKWAIPETLVGKNVIYEVTSQPGGKTCTTASTLCVFRGLEPWTSYNFSVAVKSGATGISASDSSMPLKPVRILARNKTVKTTSLLTPAASGKLQWRVGGGCKLSKDFATLTTPKDATTCLLSVRSPKSGKTQATTRSITIDVRAVVN
jgi:hypothetical protein